MEVYALVLTLGISTGSKTLLGLYDNWDKAVETRQAHMQKHCYGKHHYSIYGIKLNEAMNVTLA